MSHFNERICPERADYDSPGYNPEKKENPENKKALKGRNKEEKKMPQSLAQILFHISFKTKNREPFIRPDVESELYAYIVTIYNNMGCYAHQIGGFSDHVRLLVVLKEQLPFAICWKM